MKPEQRARRFSFEFRKPESTKGLRPCPECGGTPGVSTFEPFGRAHGGTTIGGCGITVFRRYKRDAVRAWNRKVSRTPAKRNGRAK